MKERFDKKSIILIIIIILTSTASFALGRLSIAEELKDRSRESAQVIIPKLEDLKVDTTKFKFVASKSGTKYYPIDCKSALRIKEENRIYFVDGEEAQKAGLTETSTCN